MTIQELKPVMKRHSKV